MKWMAGAASNPGGFSYGSAGASPSQTVVPRVAEAAEASDEVDGQRFVGTLAGSATARQGCGFLDCRPRSTANRLVRWAAR